MYCFAVLFAINQSKCNMSLQNLNKKVTIFRIDLLSSPVFLIMILFLSLLCIMMRIRMQLNDQRKIVDMLYSHPGGFWMLTHFEGDVLCFRR